PASPSIETVQDPASGTVGATFKDTAKLSGLFGAHAEIGRASCRERVKTCDAAEGGQIASDGPVSVDGNGEYATPHGASPTQAGTYYWVATYSGEANNDDAVSGCADEPVKIGPASPSIETVQDPASGTVGATIKDTAKLSGLFGAHAGGTVSFKLFNNKTCDASEGGLIASDGPVAVDGNGEYATPHGASPTQAGTYYWVATYSGEAHNKEPVTGCAHEPAKIGPASPSVETVQDPASGTVGATFKDTAKLSGLFGAHACGTVSFKLCNHHSCPTRRSSDLASDGPVAVDGNGEYATPHGASPTQAGTYYWVATYSGEPNNKEAVSGCADEPVKIGPASPKVERTEERRAGKEGETIKDTANP